MKCLTVTSDMGGFGIFAILMILIALPSVRMFPFSQRSQTREHEGSLMQQIWFCNSKESLINQSVTVRNMEDQNVQDCTFPVTKIPFNWNCTESGYLIFLKNETCVEMMTKDLDTKNWRMEYGENSIGDGLPGAPGERLNEMSVMDKIAEYTKSAKNSHKMEMSIGLIFGALLFTLFFSIG